MNLIKKWRNTDQLWKKLYKSNQIIKKNHLWRPKILQVFLRKLLYIIR